MREYETMVIVDAMISDEAISRELDVIKSKIEAHGEIVRIDNWGKRKMAYQINKKSHGNYTVFNYNADADVVKDLEDGFRINETILRWMTLKDYPMTDMALGDKISSSQGDDDDDDSSNDSINDDMAED